MITKLQPTCRQRVMDYIMTEFFHFWMNVTFKKAELCDVANCFNVYASCPKQKFKFWLWNSQILLWTFLNHCVRFIYCAHCDFQVPTKNKLLKSVRSETYRVTQRVCPVPRQPAWSWLESVTYGCIVWHASLQAVPQKPSNGAAVLPDVARLDLCSSTCPSEHGAANTLLQRTFTTVCRFLLMWCDYEMACAPRPWCQRVCMCVAAFLNKVCTVRGSVHVCLWFNRWLTMGC